MNKGEKWVKGGVHYPRRVIQTKSDVIWTNILICDISNDDESNSTRSHQYRESGEFHRWCNYWDGRIRRTWWVGRRDSMKISKEWFVCKTRKIQVEGERDQISRSSNML